MLVYDPRKRITSEDVLRHEYFKEFHNEEEELSCTMKIKLPVSDNEKMPLNFYREAIY